jgi:hypothetical protein
MFSHYSIIPIVQILFCSLVYHSSIRFSFSCSPTQDSLIDYQVPANQCHKMRKTPYQIPSSTFSLTLYSCSSYRCAPRGRLPLLAILQRVRRVHLPLGCWKTQKHREKKTARSLPQNSTCSSSTLPPLRPTNEFLSQLYTKPLMLVISIQNFPFSKGTLPQSSSQQNESAKQQLHRPQYACRQSITNGYQQMNILTHVIIR